MISASFLLIFFVPVFYVLVQRGSESLWSRFKGKSTTPVSE